MFTQEAGDRRGHATSGSTGVLNNPRPLRGDIPILVGGSGERKTLRLVAQYADACNIFGDPERVTPPAGRARRHCADVGRDPARSRARGSARSAIAATHEEAERPLARGPTG